MSANRVRPANDLDVRILAALRLEPMYRPELARSLATSLQRLDTELAFLLARGAVKTIDESGLLVRVGRRGRRILDREHRAIAASLRVSNA